MEYGDITIQDEASRLPDCKIATLSFNSSTATPISVTGVGFRPSFVWVAAQISATVGCGCIGVTRGNAPTLGFSLHPFENVGANYWGVDGYFIYFDTPLGDIYWHTDSMDVDGFTISPDSSGHGYTINCRFMCFK